MTGQLQRFRYFLMAALCACAAAAALIVPHSFVLLLAVLAGWATAFAGLRHLFFAGAVAFAPLPALLWFRPEFALALKLPRGLGGSAGEAYPLLFAAALVIGMGFARALLDGATKTRALAEGLLALPAIAAMLVLAPAARVNETALALWAGGISVILTVSAAALALPFGERFYFSANRARESWTRWLEPASRLTEARWSASFSGAALVLAVLAGFGHADVIGLWRASWSSLVVILLAVVVAARDWRAGLGALASALLLLAFGVTAMGLSVFVLFAVQLLRAAHGQESGERQSAWARAVERQAPGLIAATIGAALAGFILDGTAVAVEILGAALVALILFPALTLALHHFVPRRRSFKERYTV